MRAKIHEGRFETRFEVLPRLLLVPAKTIGRRDRAPALLVSGQSRRVGGTLASGSCGARRRRSHLGPRSRYCRSREGRCSAEPEPPRRWVAGHVALDDLARLSTVRMSSFEPLGDVLDLVQPGDPLRSENIGLREIPDHRNRLTTKDSLLLFPAGLPPVRRSCSPRDDQERTPDRSLSLPNTPSPPRHLLRCTCPHRVVLRLPHRGAPARWLHLRGHRR